MFQEKLSSKHNRVLQATLFVSLIILVILAAGCSQAPINCYQQPYDDLSEALDYASNDELPFQYPLDELGLYDVPAPARFCKASFGIDPAKYHAAEDYHLPAGSPVYAFADGEISFSGKMGGYGWLIIVDHPQFNIYSLYGHLSPSRWYMESGSVEKGDLIGYLGDSDENGGSAENPLVTHLHFGIRVGQRVDYPGTGEWRWMAGWIKYCPSDLGWLKPSAVITGQEVPPGGFQEPKAKFLEIWRGELILVGIYVLAGTVALIQSLRKKNIIIPIIYGVTMIIAGIIFSTKETRAQYALFVLAAVSFGFAFIQFLQKRKAIPEEELKD
jgi:murein DD-endopeptidase MepM/ murein hydrolase activator NlpD